MSNSEISSVCDSSRSLSDFCRHISADKKDIIDIRFNDLLLEKDRLGYGRTKVMLGQWKEQPVAVAIFRKLGKANTIDDINEFHLYVEDRRRLDHRFIVNLLGVCSCPPNLAIISECITGGDLTSLLHSDNAIGPSLPLLSRLYLLRSIADGINHFHLHDVVHCDLKPSTILLNKYLQPKIASISMARSGGQGVAKLGMLGNPSWMAPELLTGGTVTSKVDVYCWAMLAYEVLSCIPPFSFEKNTSSIVRLVCNNKRPELSIVTVMGQALSLSLCDLITLCWSGDPNSRPDIENVLRAMDEFIRDEYERTYSNGIETCILCMTSCASSPLPCGHTVACGVCSNVIGKCPICPCLY